MELACASNLDAAELRQRLDTDLYDRLSHLPVEIPPLRECREDIADDWRRVWRELCRQESLPPDAPWNPGLDRALASHELLGNLRDLQRLAVLVMAWWAASDIDKGIVEALGEWVEWTVTGPLDEGNFGAGTRRARVRWFQARLARWAK